MNYPLEELFPILQQLTDSYTHKDSTSVPYELAEQLMTAVLYCIEAYESNPETAAALRRRENISAQEAYRTGRKLVYEKTVAAKDLYEQILRGFDAYGNHTCYDTVVKGFPAFFLYYDPDFAPQNHILTLDYPILRPLQGLCGVNAIWEYLNNIGHEQKFLRQFPADYIRKVLENEYPGYEHLVMNLCGPILRHALCCMIIGKPIRQVVLSPSDYDALAAFAGGTTPKERKPLLHQMLETLILKVFGTEPAILAYLQSDLADFSARLALFDELYPHCGRFQF